MHAVVVPKPQTPIHWEEQVAVGCTTDPQGTPVTGGEDFNNISQFLGFQFVAETDEQLDVVSSPPLEHSMYITLGSRAPLSNLAWKPVDLKEQMQS